MNNLNRLKAKLPPMRRELHQRGAVLILTALTLPLLIAGTGLAVDLGNVYLQHARLQNAADAAALAGANAYADNNESISSHPKANAEAYEYILGDYHNLAASEEIASTDYKAVLDSTTNATIYGVRITKDVPLYFFGGLFDGGTIPISAHSEASIISINNINAPTNLFLFEKYFGAVNTVENPEKLNPAENNYYKNNGASTTGMVNDYYDGKISYTDHYGKATAATYVEGTDVTIDYSNQSPYLKWFYTSKAKTDNQTKNMDTIMADSNEAKFDSSGNLESGYYHYPKFEAYDYEPFMTYVKELTADTPVASSRDITDSSPEMSSDYVRVSGINPSITINNPLPYTDKNVDTPIYIYIEPTGGDVMNINLYADTGRPLVICLNNSETSSMKVHFNMNGHTFKGLIYTPYTGEWGEVLVNTGGGNFYGSIYAGYRLQINGGNAKFVFKDYIGSGSSSGSSSSGNHKISLTNNAISWD